MIPVPEERLLIVKGAQTTKSFGLDSNDLPHIFNILRSSLYSNKILAVLREYGANALDANRENGKGDVPIKVTLPNRLEPALTIRDYGKGLSEDAIYNVYAFYAKSTKRDSNVAIGHFGIGAKAGFAYNDSFSITSYHNGKKTLYHAVIDETDLGVIMKMGEIDCPLDETGLEIKVPVHTTDVYEFHKEARNLFKWFQPQPIINEVTLENPYNGFSDTELTVGKFSQGYSEKWICVMGGIPYNLDVSKLEKHGVFVPPHYGGVLIFGIGELEITASRESVEYKPRTIKFIADKLDNLMKEIEKEYLEILDNATLSALTRHKLTNTVRQNRGFIPARIEDRTQKELRVNRVLSLFTAPDSLDDKADAALMSPTDALAEIAEPKCPLQIIDKDAGKISYRQTKNISYGVIFVDEAKGPLKYYSLNYRVLLIRRHPAFSQLTTAECVELIEERLKECELDGCTIELLSSHSGYFRQPPSKENKNKIKYTHKVFKAKNVRALTGANNWDIYTLADTDKGVTLPYIRIHRFKPLHSDVYYDWAGINGAHVLIKTPDYKHPTMLLGIKPSTDENKIEKMKKDGYNLVPFDDWINEEKEKILNTASPELKMQIKLYRQAKQLWGSALSPHILDKVRSLLGPNHLIIKLWETMIVAKDLNIPPFMETIFDASTETVEMKSILSKYPLLNLRYNNVFNTLTENPVDWAHYILSMDRLTLLEQERRDEEEERRELLYDYARQYYVGD